MNIVINISQRLLAFFYWLGSLLWYRLFVSGQENLANLQGPLVVVANHKSLADHFFIGAAFPRWLTTKLLPMRIMAKDSLFSNPLAAALFTMLGSYPAYYKQGIDKSLQIPLDLLGQSAVVAIYPEGKRIYEDKLGDFKRGAGELISRAGQVTVLPVIVKNTTGMFSQLIPRFGQKVEVRYGLPLSLVNETPEVITEILRLRMLELYERESVPADSRIKLPVAKSGKIKTYAE